MKTRSKVILLASALAFGAVEPAGAVFVTRKTATHAAATTTTGTTTTTTPAQSVAAPAAKLFKRVAQQKKKGMLHRVMNRMTSKIVVALLAFFLGSFGVHRFYLGYTREGFLQLGGTVLGYALIFAGAIAGITIVAVLGYVILLAVGIWAFVDFIRILTGGLEPANGSYD